MLLYTDKLTGDELFTDSYPIKEIDDVAYEVECEMIQLGNDNNINIGANPSAEGGEDDGVDESVIIVNNVVNNFGLVPTTFDKKTYMGYIKSYMKALKAKLNEQSPERVPIFEKNATTLIKKILGNFKDYEFYTGASMDVDGMVALLNYREDGTTPYFTFFKDGVKSDKI